MEALLFHDTAKMDVHAAIVMPDHAHLVCTLYWDRGGELIRLSELMQSIKGYSAFAIKKKLKMKGHVWLDESFDHVIRNFEGIDAKCDYLKMNPVRRGLVKDPLKYRWLYAEDMVDWNENMGEDNKPLPALKVWQKKWQA